jgi:hypothetical protein
MLKIPKIGIGYCPTCKRKFWLDVIWWIALIGVIIWGASIEKRFQEECVGACAKVCPCLFQPQPLIINIPNITHEENTSHNINITGWWSNISSNIKPYRPD